MNDCLSGIRQVEGEGPYWHYGQARRWLSLADQGQTEALERAEQHVTKARSLRPNWFLPARLAGLLAQAKDDDETAIEHFKLAIELGDNEADVIRRVSALLYRNGRYAEADQMFRRLEKQASLSGLTGRLAADVSLRMKDYDRAVAMARTESVDSQDYRDSLWLSRVLRIAARQAEAEQRDDEAKAMLQEAEDALRNAVKMEGAGQEAWLDLVRFLVVEERREEAVAVVEGIERNLADRFGPLFLARCYDLVDRDAEAQGCYEKALASSSDDVTVVRSVVRAFLRGGEVAKAKVQLRRIISGDLKADRQNQMWARRTLAMFMGTKIEAQASAEALQLVQANLDLQPD
jgi:tetratricopeptide (TPR) repeat protein